MFSYWNDQEEKSIFVSINMITDLSDQKLDSLINSLSKLLAKDQSMVYSSLKIFTSTL